MKVNDSNVPKGVDRLNSSRSTVRSFPQNDELRPGNGANESADGVGVNLSSRALTLGNEHAKALKIAQETSPVREDRVRELREKIQKGEYRIDSGKIADGILREAIKEKIAQGIE